jgi:lysine 2,3-aminomutase
MKHLNNFLKNIPKDKWFNWHWQVENSISKPPKNIITNEKEILAVLEKYPFKITPYYFALIHDFSEKNPIFRMSFPTINELLTNRYTREDPFDEDIHSPVPGIINRYKNRVVLMATNICAVNCRHCTRKNRLKDYNTEDYFNNIFNYLEKHKEIREVLVSGGDPLMLSDEKIDWLINNIKKNEHIKIIRIGTRIPATLPMRITPELANILSKHSPVWISTHFNHPAELTNESEKACKLLVEKGIPLVNQTVLLKGVNDDIQTLKKLFNGLQEMRIKPYYAFLGDPVLGTEHFYFSPEKTKKLEKMLREQISGLAMPAFVADIADKKSKVPIKELRAES